MLDRKYKNSSFRENFSIVRRRLRFQLARMHHRINGGITTCYTLSIHANELSTKLVPTESLSRLRMGKVWPKNIYMAFPSHNLSLFALASEKFRKWRPVLGKYTRITYRICICTQPHCTTCIVCKKYFVARNFCPFVLCARFVHVTPIKNT